MTVDPSLPPERRHGNDRPEREVQGQEPEAQQQQVDGAQHDMEGGQEEHDGSDQSEHVGHLPAGVTFSPAVPAWEPTAEEIAAADARVRRNKAFDAAQEAAIEAIALRALDRINTTENELLRSILRKLADAHVANLYDLTVSDGTGMASAHLTYREAELFGAIATEETPT